MAPRRLPLDRVIAPLRRALLTCADLYLGDLTRDLTAGRTVAQALTSVPRVDGYLRRAMEEGWATAWRTTSLEVEALVKRNPRRWRRYDRARRAEQFAAEEPVRPRLRLPAPVYLPREWREYDPTESRSTAEWLADHESSVSQYVPYEYRDAYLEKRLPPLAGIVDDRLKRAARDTAAAVAERGFGVRESMQALRETFPEFSEWRLETIARTEGATLYEHGRAARYLADPVVIGIRLNGTADSRQTDICADADGNCYRLDSPGLLWPPYHYNCRTTPEPILFDEEDATDWTDTPVAAMEGFGTPDYGSLPDNAGQQELPF